MNSPSAVELQRASNLVELQKTLYASRNYTRRRIHSSRFEWIKQAILQHHSTSPNSIAIEYGPGSGIYLPILANEYQAVVGADIERAYLDDIASLQDDLPHLEIVIDDLIHSKFPTNHFGLVLCTEVLEHVPSPELALHTIYRILAPGGIAIITTPQKYSVMEWCCKVAFLPGILPIVRFVYQEPVFELGHISLRSARQIQDVIKANGFEVIAVDKFGLYLPLIAEFGGKLGGLLIEVLEKKLKDTVFDGLLWTQAYVLRKPS
jgi:2-polyprenyl-3-methyl-5-hydroxy-6-metoxy-1,4-benzoquinol methylase